jgi:hypothetical protein
VIANLMIFLKTLNSTNSFVKQRARLAIEELDLRLNLVASKEPKIVMRQSLFMHGGYSV